MATIEEKRRRLDAKLQEMAEDGVLQGPSSATADFDPIDEERSVLEKTELSAPPEQVAALRPSGVVFTIEEYCASYFVPLRIREKTSFTMNAETLEILRSVLQDLHERVSMVSYIDNIIREHLRAHRELLNQASAKQGVKRRSPYDDNDTTLRAPFARHRVAHPWYRLQLRALEGLIPPKDWPATRAPAA